MRPYEAMYIVEPDQTSEQIEAIVAKYSKIVTDGGGTVVSATPWEGGRRRMAYEIKGRREGFYILMAFDSPPEVPKELDRIFKISDDCIRHLIVNRVEVDPGRPPQFHPRPSPGEQAAPPERRDAAPLPTADAGTPPSAEPGAESTAPVEVAAPEATEIAAPETAEPAPPAEPVVEEAAPAEESAPAPEAAAPEKPKRTRKPKEPAVAEAAEVAAAPPEADASEPSAPEAEPSSE